MKRASAKDVIPANIATAFGGGFLIGRYFIGLEPFALVAAPKAEGEIVLPWNKSEKKVAGALGLYNGLANTEAMAKAGSELGKWARGLELGGFDDWYLASRGEALLAFAANGDLPEAERFERTWYWTSTQYAGSPEDAWLQDFAYGCQDYWLKSYKSRARAVRRVPIR